MQIPLNVLLYSLSANSIFEVQKTNLSDTFDGIKLFDINEPSYSGKNYLYLVTTQMLKSYSSHFLCEQILSSRVFLCICADDSLHAIDFNADLSMVLLYTKECFPVVFNQILTIFHDFDKWDKSFHLALLRGDSLQDLLDISKDLLVHPMIVFDRNYSILGYTRADTDQDVPDPFMEELVGTGYATPEAMSKLQADGLISASEDAANPLINYYCLTDHNCYYSMMYRFTSNHNTVGYALVLRCSTHPRTNYLYLMNMVYENLQLYFQQERFSTRSSSEIYEAVLTDILEHPEIPRQQLMDQVRYIPNLSPEGRFVLAKVTYTGTTELPHSFVSWNLRNSIPGLKPFSSQNSLYILRDNTNAEDCTQFLNEDEEKIFLENLRNHTFTCGVSQTFFSLSDLSMAAQQCAHAIRLGAKIFPEVRNFYHFSDVTLYYTWEELKKTVPVEMVISPYYTVLKEHDEKHNSDLCEIFTRFLLNGRNVNQTSSKIFMHRNTVLNKVKKAVSVMHCEFEEYHAQLAFVLAYMNDHEI